MLNHSLVLKRVHFCLAQAEQFFVDIFIIFRIARRSAFGRSALTHLPVGKMKWNILDRLGSDFGMLQGEQPVQVFELRVAFDPILRGLAHAGGNTIGL